MNITKGTIVNVINEGHCYARYSKWIYTWKNEISKEYREKWECGKRITDTTDCFRVLLVKEHLSFGNDLALIENHTGVFIIAVNGIEIE